jgi:hypothetical protein
VALEQFRGLRSWLAGGARGSRVEILTSGMGYLAVE